MQTENIRVIAMYHFKQGETKTRFNCIGQSGNYQPFEEIKAADKDGILKVYYTGQNANFSANAKARGSHTLTARMKGRSGKSETLSITTLSFENDRNFLTAHGDFKGTEDALLVHFAPHVDGKGKEFKVYALRGGKRHQGEIYNLWRAMKLEPMLQSFRQARESHTEAVNRYYNRE